VTGESTSRWWVLVTVAVLVALLVLVIAFSK
jgi:LPXTG-motif cell wall-anchored protein